MATLGMLVSLIFIVMLAHAQIGEIDENDFDRYENQAEQQFLAYGVNPEISDKMSNLFFVFARRTEDHCKKQGQAVLDEVNNSFGTLMNCGETIMKTQRSDQENSWNFVCQRKSMFMKCLKDFTTTVDLCILNEDKYIIDFVHNFVDAVFSFGCSEDGQRIFEMMEERKRPRCFKDKKEYEAHAQCMNTGMMRRTIAATHLRDILTFNAADCRDFEGIFECMKNNLKRCNDDRVIPILRSIHTSAYGITHCDQGDKVGKDGIFPDKQSSASAVAIYLQFLLLPALITSF